MKIQLDCSSWVFDKKLAERGWLDDAQSCTSYDMNGIESRILA
ncbi:hypothetical protein [Sphingomonas mollis]|nr:hypothetical protein [Sphingomonas sp. BT553]